MQKIFPLLLLFCVAIIPSYAQLVVQNGAAITTTGGAAIMLQDISLVNNGTINQQPGAGKFIFTGSGDDTISGSNAPLFDTLEVAKTGNAVLQLGYLVYVGSAVKFTSGFIDLHGQNLVLNNTVTNAAPAMLLGESETSHIIGPLGGNVSAYNAANVSNPNALNISNLGAAITTANSLGSVQITRSHQPAANVSNAAFTGIQRRFDINPLGVNSGLNATLRFYYLDAELNGKNENSLVLWKSTDGGITWLLAGADSRNTVLNYVEKTGINDFSSWTLTDASNPLPITLVAFKATCENNYALLQWQTATEINTASFVIEKSTDASVWQYVQTIAAQNNINGAHYSYKDEVPLPVVFYRLKMVDEDGSYTYSPVFSGGCTEAAAPFVVYPNPARDQATARLSVRQDTQAVIQLLSATGQLIAQYDWDLQTGLNNFNIPGISLLPAGIYTVKLVYNSNSVQVKLVKK